MDPVEYQQLVTYLSTLILPPDIPVEKQRTFRRLATFYLVRGSLLYRKNRQSPNTPLRVVLSKDVELILRAFHEDPFAGHLGVKRTYQKIAERYYWPEMPKQVYDFVKTCDVCQRRGPIVKRPEPLYPLKVGDPFDRVGIDMVGPLPITARGNSYIIVATDYLTRWPEARPTTDTKAETAATFLKDCIFTQHGAPKELLSDRGTTFLNKMLAALCEQWETKQVFASAYHPQTNGLVERFNKTLVETLAKLCLKRPSDWDELIPAALFAYRTAKQETTRQTPFFLLYGREATYPLETIINTYPQETVGQSLEYPDSDVLLHQALRLYNLEENRSTARELTEREQLRQAQRYNQMVRPQGFCVNDLVLRYDSKGAGSHSGKLDSKWLGPYRVATVLGKGVYRLAELNGEVDNKPINARRLKLYRQRAMWDPRVIIDLPPVLETSRPL